MQANPAIKAATVKYTVAVYAVCGAQSGTNGGPKLPWSWLFRLSGVAHTPAFTADQS